MKEGLSETECSFPLSNFCSLLKKNNRSKKAFILNLIRVILSATDKCRKNSDIRFMIIKGFGISLHRLQHDDIELVRQKRNAPNVSSFMEYREEITPEMQEKWFQSINNEKNNYFLIEYNGEKIGLIYAAEIDWEKMITGNSGIFIWDEQFRKTSVPLAAALLL